MTVSDLKDHLDERLDKQDVQLTDLHTSIYGSKDTQGIRERLSVVEDRVGRGAKLTYAAIVVLLGKIGIDLPL